MSSQAVTAIGIIVDLLVCTLFALRLTSLYKKDATNLFLKYFVWFFWVFDTFLFLTIFYIPDLIVSRQSEFFKISFAIAFLALYLMSAYAARIVALVNFPKFDHRLIFWPIAIAGIFVTATLIMISGPIITYTGGSYVLQFTTIQIILMSVPVSGSFLAASYTFLVQAFRDPKNRLRSLLLSLSFLFWVAGGATHSIAFSPFSATISDAVTMLGFITAFIALIKDPKK